MKSLHLTLLMFAITNSTRLLVFVITRLLLAFKAMLKWLGVATSVGTMPLVLRVV